MDNKKILPISAVALIVVLIAVFLLLQQTPQTPSTDKSSDGVTDSEKTGDSDGTKDQGATDTEKDGDSGDSVEKPETLGNVVEFTMVAKQWEFDPATITVNEGDNVVLTIESIDVTHGFTLSEFGVSERLEPGKSVTIKFTADQTGEFRFFCSVFCGEGHTSMGGTLIVQ